LITADIKIIAKQKKMVKPHSPIAHCKVPLEVTTPSKYDEMIPSLKAKKSLKQVSISSGSAPIKNSQILAVSSEKKCLQFRPQVTVREIRHRNDMTKEMMEQMWMTPEEFTLIKVQCRMTLRLMRLDHSVNEEFHRAEFCARGLEVKTKDGQRERRDNKNAVRSAVIREQQAQRENGISDANFIAVVSMMKSQKSIRAARLVALQDAEEAVEYLSEA
jgi:hypothetical protein